MNRIFVDDLPLEAPTESGRRSFLRIMGASLALGGSVGCSRAPRGEIVPYAVQPPEVVPGVPSHYATALTREGYAVGIIGECHEGRPTKIEGNPLHPLSLGGTGIAEQAALLGVYDRDRGKAPLRHGAVAALREVIDEMALNPTDRGVDTHLLLEPTSSPTTIALLARFRERYPHARVHFHAPLTSRNSWDGATRAFGRAYESHHRFRNADVIVAFDSDFLAAGPAALRSARELASRRKRERASDLMNRLYVVEPAPTITGANADHRLRAKRAATLDILAALVAEIVARSRDRLPLATTTAIAPLRGRAEPQKRWILSAANDLLAHRSRSLVLVGEAQPPIAHALAHLANFALGNFGSTIDLTASPIFEGGEVSHSLSSLVSALRSRAVESLLVLGGNPAYASPHDLDLAQSISLAKRSLYLGSHENETAHVANHYLPLAHPLESWSDARALDGTATIAQPLVSTLDGVHTVDEILACFLGDPRSQAFSNAHDLVREEWRRSHATTFDEFWRDALSRGVIADSAFPKVAPPFDWDRIATACATFASESLAASSLELVIHEDARVRDGATTNNPWLLELPDPVHKLTWENAALISKTTAARLSLSNGDVVTLARVGQAGASVDAPILVVPGVADDVVAISLGYGRRGKEEIAAGIGFDAYAMQTDDARWGARELSVSKTGTRQTLALAQNHFSLEGRDEDIFLHRTVAEFDRDPDFARSQNAEKRSLYVLPAGARRQWGMVVDLSACTGCSACVIACQAENNISVVGKEGVAKSREMHWLRIDRYLTSDDDDARALSQPMMCQHCERAPCEYVCPVNATTHSSDGINQMVYNRCVGTRFCSNNCPWKVRRFNWFDYAAGDLAPDAQSKNPDVTVRARGVMEKCTYCVQRIREAEIRAEVEKRPLKDGDVTTACEQACPSAAIVFGDIKDETSAVSRARKSPRLYAVLNDLGTVPHTRYLAKIRNPNGDLA